MQPVKVRTLLFYLIASGVNCIAQSGNPDSLRNVINSNGVDKQKIEAYKGLAGGLAIKNFDEGMNAASAGYQLALKAKDSSSMGEFDGLAGSAHYFKGNYDSAASFFYRALNLLKKNTDKKKKAGILNELARLYRKTKDLERATQIYDEAFAIYEDLGDEDGMATILNESGVVFEYKGDYDEAINRYNKSLAVRKKLRDTIGIAYSYNFLGGVFTLQKKFAEAEKYLIQSLELRQKLKDTFAIALSYSDLASMYAEKGEYDKSISQYLQSNEIAARMKYPELLLTNYKYLADIAEKKGDILTSLRFLKQHFSLKDSVYSGEKMKQIEELNARYQSVEKEQQLKLQKAEITKKNYLLGRLSIGVILVFIAGFSFYRKRQVQHTLHLQAELMNQQDMATKAVIVAEETERKRIAAELHDGVGQMMSAVKMNLSSFENEMKFRDEEQKIQFENVISLVDESCSEIRSVSHQMMPNALLKNGLANAIREFIDKIDNRVLRINLHTEGLNERLDSNVETILYRVIQECVNNVIKHSGANVLDISLIKDTDGIAATVEDNGRGFDISDRQKSEGIGLKNLNSRVGFLKGKVDFDSAPGRGTLIAIHVPLA